MVLYTFYPNLPIFLHRYICQICDISQLWSAGDYFWAKLAKSKKGAVPVQYCWIMIVPRKILLDHHCTEEANLGWDYGSWVDWPPKMGTSNTWSIKSLYQAETTINTNENIQYKLYNWILISSQGIVQYLQATKTSNQGSHERRFI